MVCEKCGLKRISLASYHRTSTNYFKLIICCSTEVSLKKEKSFTLIWFHLIDRSCKIFFFFLPVNNIYSYINFYGGKKKAMSTAFEGVYNLTSAYGMKKCHHNDFHLLLIPWVLSNFLGVKCIE